MNLTALSQSSFSDERLEAAIANYLKKQTTDDIEVEVLQKMKTAIFEDDGVSAVFSNNIREFKGLCKVTVEFKKSDKLIRKEDVKVRIRKYKTLPVASKTLNISELVDNSDMIWHRVDVTDMNLNDIIATTDVIGKKLKNAVIKGSPFGIRDIETERLVKRGQNVEIIAQSGAVEIKTLGTALQDGAVGDIIRVKREGSGSSIMSGEVDASGAVILRSFKNMR